MFNPDKAGIPNGRYFALPCTPADSALVLLSVPWDATASYGTGAADAPAAILAASAQVDLYDLEYGAAWQKGIATIPINSAIYRRNSRMRTLAQRAIAKIERGTAEDAPPIVQLTKRVNEASAWVNAAVCNTALSVLHNGQIPALVGGDHSTPYGLLCALAKYHTSFGILHIDAHADLRCCYEGFQHSHASIMYNVLHNIPQVARIVQVGVRDVGQDEHALAQSNNRILQYNIYDIAHRLFCGSSTWNNICTEIVQALPQHVYISLDVDGLSPDNCPSTGTPVPGGLSFLQLTHLLRVLCSSGRHIIGFDLCEVCPRTQADTITGARLLYKLCGAALLHRPA